MNPGSLSSHFTINFVGEDHNLYIAILNSEVIHFNVKLMSLENS